METRTGARSGRITRAKRGWVGYAVLGLYTVLRVGDPVLAVIGLGGVPDDLAVWERWLEGWPTALEFIVELMPILALAWLLYWTFTGRIFPRMSLMKRRRMGSADDQDDRRRDRLERLIGEGHHLAMLFTRSDGQDATLLNNALRTWQREASKDLGPAAEESFKKASFLPVDRGEITQKADVIQRQIPVIVEEVQRLGGDGGAFRTIEAFGRGMSRPDALEFLRRILENFGPGAVWNYSSLAPIQFELDRALCGGQKVHDLGELEMLVSLLTDLGLAIKPSDGTHVPQARRTTEKGGDVLKALNQSASRKS